MHNTPTPNTQTYIHTNIHRHTHTQGNREEDLSVSVCLYIVVKWRGKSASVFVLLYIVLKWRENVVAVYFGVIVHSCEMKRKDLRSISVWLDTALWKWRGKISEVFLCGWTQLCESEEERSQKYFCVVGHSSEVKKEDLRNTLKSRGKISEIPVWLDTALKWRGKISEMFLCGWTQLWTEEERSQKYFCVVGQSEEYHQHFFFGCAELRSREERSQQYFGTHLGPDSGLLMDSATGDDVIYDKVSDGVSEWRCLYVWRGVIMLSYLWQDSRGSVRPAYAHFCW